MKLFIIILLNLLYIGIHSAPIPDINLNDSSSYGSKNFTILLPTNETIIVNLSVQMLKHTISSGTPITETSTTTTTTSSPIAEEVIKDLNIETTTTTATTNTPIAAEVIKELNIDSKIAQNDSPLITVEEAIEAFKQELMLKEKAIGGIIESDNIFYRHFQLNRDDEHEIKIRCTYNAVFKKRRLDINCFEYMEIATNRVLSNGELESYTAYDLEYKSNKNTLIDLRKYKQTYHMEIN